MATALPGKRAATARTAGNRRVRNVGYAMARGTGLSTTIRHSGHAAPAARRAGHPRRPTARLLRRT